MGLGLSTAVVLQCCVFRPIHVIKFVYRLTTLCEAEFFHTSPPPSEDTLGDYLISEGLLSS